MLSLVERGKTSPSIGTLVAIASALGVHMTDLFDNDGTPQREPVARHEDQHVYVTGEGVQRRVLRTDAAHGIEFVMNEYENGDRKRRRAGSPRGPRIRSRPRGNAHGRGRWIDLRAETRRFDRLQLEPAAQDRERWQRARARGVDQPGAMTIRRFEV